jgi:nucleotide-binding universal stress UspA family protein
MTPLATFEENAALAELKPVEPWSERLVVRNLLCGVDFTEFSTSAFRYAAGIARHFGSHLYVQHIVSIPTETSWSMSGSGMVRERLRGSRRIAEEGLRRLQAEAAIEDLNVTYMLNDGDVRSQILGTIERRQIDLLVLGSHPHRGITRLREGSLAERLAQEANCPVLVVARPQKKLPEAEWFEPPPLKTVLLATDFSRNSDRALTCALRWTAEWSAHLTLVHTVETGSRAMQAVTDLLPESDPGREHRIREAWEKLRTLIPDPTHVHCQLDYEVRDGDPREQILQCAAERKADLIVMGARGLGRSSLTHPFAWGSTLSGVIRDGRFPVLAIRHLGG